MPARLRVAGHRLAVIRRRACGKTTRGEFAVAVRSGVRYGPGVKARVLCLQRNQLLPYARAGEAMRDLFDCRLCSGAVAGIARGCSEALLETELKIKRGLRRSAVTHADETGLRVEGRLHFVHVASNSRLTHYAAASGRGRTAMEEADVLPRYRGTCVHDGWPAESFYTQCRHALCGAHLLRGLNFFAELSEETRAWAAPLKDVLVCDLGMPGEDGFSLIRRVRALPPGEGGETQAAALTAYARDEDRVSALASGFQVHIPKPVDPEELTAVIANLTRVPGRGR